MLMLPKIWMLLLITSKIERLEASRNEDTAGTTFQYKVLKDENFKV
jgi:hypothetical protein